MKNNNKFYHLLKVVEVHDKGCYSFFAKQLTFSTKIDTK